MFLQLPKQLLIPLLLVAIVSCKEKSHKKDNGLKTPIYIGKTFTGDGPPTVRDSLLRYARGQIKGGLRYEHHYGYGQVECSDMLSIHRDTANESGSIHLDHWEWQEDRFTDHWSFQDSISCGEADLALSYDIDRIGSATIDSDHVDDIVLVYTLSCTYDVSPQTRYLVVLDRKGKQVLKLRGWSMDPASLTDPAKVDHKYDPRKHDYNPSSPEGRIENFSVLTDLPEEGRKKILSHWLAALKKDRERKK